MMQYYFETIFPRIPKTVGDEIRGYLRDWGLPTEARGNAGQGGADRRGMDDGSRRPASVKASLSVAFGQRAPNRPGVREVSRCLRAQVVGRCHQLPKCFVQGLPSQLDKICRFSAAKRLFTVSCWRRWGAAWALICS